MMIGAVLANLVPFEIIPEEKEWGQVAFSAEKGTKPHWKVTWTL